MAAGRGEVNPVKDFLGGSSAAYGGEEVGVSDRRRMAGRGSRGAGGEVTP